MYRGAARTRGHLLPANPSLELPKSACQSRLVPRLFWELLRMQMRQELLRMQVRPQECRTRKPLIAACLSLET